MIQYYKSKKIMFLISAIIITLILVFIIIWAISFLKKSITSVSDENINKDSKIIEFEFEKLKKAGIIKD